MALVAYDDSDITDSEEEETLSRENNLPGKNVQSTQLLSSKLPQPINDKINCENLQTIFEQLPQPKTEELLEEDDEILHKKEVRTEEPVKPKVKISIPSLSDFKDVESNAIKKKQPSKKGSGLLGLLPQPKNASSSFFKTEQTKSKPSTATTTSFSLTPTVLKKKSLENSIMACESVMKKSIISSECVNDDSDPDEESDLTNDFFSFNSAPSVDEIREVDVDDFEPPTIIKKAEERIETYLEDNNYFINNSRHEVSNESPNSMITETNLDEEAIRKLCGTRGRHKKEEIQFIDVNQQEVLADAKELLLKGLTDDTSTRPSASKRKGNEPSSQQKRKHQITYLAHQAKANEADLQNQWANNRLTRRQTQSKYGF